jgi:hypothetical protein
VSVVSPAGVVGGNGSAQAAAGAKTAKTETTRLIPDAPIKTMQNQQLAKVFCFFFKKESAFFFTKETKNFCSFGPAVASECGHISKRYPAEYRVECCE